MKVSITNYSWCQVILLDGKFAGSVNDSGWGGLEVNGVTYDTCGSKLPSYPTTVEAIEEFIKGLDQPLSS